MSNRRKAFEKILATKEDASTYSSALRGMNKKNSNDTIPFMKAYKDAFDEAMEEALEDHQNIALLKAKQEIE